MSGAVPLLILFVFMSCTGTDLLLSLLLQPEFCRITLIITPTNALTDSFCGLQSVFVSLHHSPQSAISLCYITTEDAVCSALHIPKTKNNFCTL